MKAIRYWYEFSSANVRFSVVNKQTESHKGLIFYLHKVQLVYNDVHHSPLTLLLLSCYLSSFFVVLPRLQKSTHPTRV